MRASRRAQLRCGAGQPPQRCTPRLLGHFARASRHLCEGAAEHVLVGDEALLLHQILRSKTPSSSWRKTGRADVST